ncbi:MAG TPA: hypothetical protein VFU36_10490 [Jatrophihabitans sp.]|nr:hypothetical protein [Jatrophihabitans sp.]
MTDLPSWSYTGVVPIENDLSMLESALHAGRVSAAERGYTGEPEISTEEVMLTDPADPPSYADSVEADRAGLEFVATHLRYRMDWPAEG